MSEEELESQFGEEYLNFLRISSGTDSIALEKMSIHVKYQAKFCGMKLTFPSASFSIPLVYRL